MAPRILLVAENASTRWGGEAILPCHYFRVLRQRGVDVHLIVHERCRAELEPLFPADHARLHFIPDRPLQRLFHSLSRLLPRRVAEATFGLANQMLTQAAQRAVLQRLVVDGTVVHQPIPVAPRFPSLLWNVGAPVVIGPMNGGMEYPPAFRSQESLAGRAVIAAGRLLSGAVQRLLPGKRRAAILLVANERTRRALGEMPGVPVLTLVENGVDLARWPAMDLSSSPTPRFAFVGRLVDWKALDLAMEALAHTPCAELDIVGDGPMRETWQSLAERLGVAHRVRFHGWIDQAACADILRDATALVLPSLYECGGAVVLEAMACARPVIATAWGGPEDYLDASCGFLIQPTSRAALVAGFRDAMTALARDPALAARMGRAGRERVEQQFDWEAKVDAMLSVYESALASKPATIPVPSTAGV